jgi:hypothetical protein
MGADDVFDLDRTTPDGRLADVPARTQGEGVDVVFEGPPHH